MVAIGKGMSKAFYRKYRSKRLSEVVGQNHITDILSRALKEGKVAHAYLFTGPRGVGKTSIARIMAHEINQLPYDDDSTHLDIIEIDAASNNGVEDIRDLRDRVRLAPVSAAKKVYIIDEVHMLSKAAFNALLKTLEEPPEHVVFILATTDADKLPATIISRTQRFNFRTIPVREAAAHLGWIAEQEGFSADQQALELIAAHGQGSFRDSIGLLDQLHSAADKKQGVTKEFVETFLGLPSSELVEKLLAGYETKDLQTIVSLLTDAEYAGVQPIALADELIATVRRTLSERPHLLPLLDSLTSVAASPRPDIKLLTALATPASVKPKSIALASRAPVLSAPVADLEQQSKLEPKPASKKPEPKPEPIPELEAKPEPAPVAPPASTTEPAAPFDWQVLMEHIRAHNIAIATVLSKCSHSLSGSTITLYTGNNFYKKKLDDSRYRASIAAALNTLGMGSLTIETVGTPPPPKDEVAASVAALMGGGTEVTLSDPEGGA